MCHTGENKLDLHTSVASSFFVVVHGKRNAFASFLHVPNSHSFCYTTMRFMETTEFAFLTLINIASSLFRD